jgi:hypothetical protein
MFVCSFVDHPGWKQILCPVSENLSRWNSIRSMVMTLDPARTMASLPGSRLHLPVEGLDLDFISFLILPIAQR